MLKLSCTINMYGLVYILLYCLVLPVISNEPTEDTNEEFPEVQIESGKIKGTFFKTPKGRQVLAFLDVPYAEPPINEFRFKEPQPVRPWSGIKETNKPTKMCSQILHYAKINNQYPMLGEDDCLYLNVYTPQLNSPDDTKLLDVVVFIHAGGFSYGSPHLYSPKYLLDKMDVVFVSINYRLGPFGFLTMDDDIIPGNNGLKDQAFALQWVQDNIKKFSGDPNKVTLIGLSAGGASVTYHYISELSRNLFNKGISLSGVATNPWALMGNGKQKSIQLAESLNCATSDSLTLLKCLQEKPALEILNKTSELFLPWLYTPFSPFGPTIELKGNKPFLKENPLKAFLDGKTKDAPWLISSTSEEGLYPSAEFINNATLLNELEENWDEIAPYLLAYKYTIPENKINSISRKIHEHYFPNKIVSLESVKEIIDLISDRMFLFNIGKTAKLLAIRNKSNIFMYKFSFRGSRSSTKILSASDEYFGVSHGDDLAYILGCFFDGFEENEDETEMQNIMLDVWTSFIKDGVPNINNKCVWQPISKSRDKNEIDYLLIKSKEEIHMVTEDNFGNKNFWDSLPLQGNDL